MIDALLQSGLLLGSVLLVLCNVATRASCHLLLHGAQVSRRRSYEQLVYHAFGSLGKTMVELLLVVFLGMTLVALFNVIGDLGPDVLRDVVRGQPSLSDLRSGVMIAIALTVVLPLCLLRDVTHLTSISGVAVIFYVLFLLRVAIISMPRLLEGGWWNEVGLWNTSGAWQAMPIFSLALACQTTVPVLLQQMPHAGIDFMDGVIGTAVNLCTGVYAMVAFFGLVAFSNHPALAADVLVLFPASMLTQAIKFGFLLSVAVTFPFIVFPCRTALHSLVFKKHNDEISDMSTLEFWSITMFLIACSAAVAIAVPQVELILGLTGSLGGALVCFVIPALIALRLPGGAPQPMAHVLAKVGLGWCTLSVKSGQERAKMHGVMALFCLAFGLLTLVTGTYTTLRVSGGVGLARLYDMIGLSNSTKV